MMRQCNAEHDYEAADGNCLATFREDVSHVSCKDDLGVVSDHRKTYLY